MVTSSGSKVSDLTLSIGPQICRAVLRVTNGLVCDGCWSRCHWLGMNLLSGVFSLWFLLISLFCVPFYELFFSAFASLGSNNVCGSTV